MISSDLVRQCSGRTASKYMPGQYALLAHVTSKRTYYGTGTLGSTIKERLLRSSGQSGTSQERGTLEI